VKTLNRVYKNQSTNLPGISGQKYREAYERVFLINLVFN